MSTIKYFRKNVYGKEMIYIDPSCPASLMVFALTRRKTIERSDIVALEKLGHSFEEVLAPVIH